MNRPRQSHRREAKAFIALAELELRGMAEPVEVTPHPAEEYAPPAIGAHRVKKVSARTGIGRHGERIDEKQVAITSNVNDQDTEVLAEIEALT